MELHDYVQKIMLENVFKPESQIVSVVHYNFSAHGEEAKLLEQSAPLILGEMQGIYPNCKIESKKHPAANQEFNVRFSIKR